MKSLNNVRVETKYLENAGFTYGTATELMDIKIDDGKIIAFEKAKNQPISAEDIDGNGQLLLPSIREMHCHFDKSKLGVPWEPIKSANSIVERFTQELIDLENLELSFAERMDNLIKLELANGVTFFRSHIDVHPKIGQKYLQQTLESLEKYHGKFGYELVAFPQHGLLLSNAYEEMKTALQNGATIVGGVDPASLDGNFEKSLHQTFELATRFDVPIDIHIHDRNQAGYDTFKELLRLTKQSGWQNRVTISHGFGLRDIPKDQKTAFFTELAQTGISVFSSVPLDGVIPPLAELRQAGVNIALGCDNVYDSWSPFGDGNVLEKLNRYNEIFKQTSQQQLSDSLELVTGKQTFGENSWLKVGAPADFVLTDSSCSAEFVARKIPVNLSLYRGNVTFSKE
ncbi:amidohydrolase [Enterococcus alishanensis]|uniref:Amidohydrolase family protein n=1 Tax=Enterococcus alishanensis TaxID=1303817 RepID=A0ABS6TA70_9ENTE|nr:amidohydrolase [Enterococcus alishanensis]MBV7389793.1 amidohydrolase family protein [Enterococcus alishanensis]